MNFFEESANVVLSYVADCAEVCYDCVWMFLRGGRGWGGGGLVGEDIRFYESCERGIEADVREHFEGDVDACD